MNIDLGMAAGYVMVAAGGFALGALAGRWMMGEMRNALGGIQMRLAALEHTVVGNGTAAKSAAAALSHSPVATAPVSTTSPMAPIATTPNAPLASASTPPIATAEQHPASAPQPAPVTSAATEAPAAPAAPEASATGPSPAAALEHHASAVEQLAAAIEKHAQAVDDHGAATVAAAIEMGGHPAPVAPSPTFATPLHAAGVAIGASVAPVAAAAAVAAPPPQA
jgi:hypothetical protein